MRKSVALGLAGIVMASLAIRLAPLWTFLFWGSDTGEYFAILRGLDQAGRVATPYFGWGVTYPYFPGMFFAQGALVELGGLDVATVLNLLVPVLGGLAVVPMFLLALRISGESRIALFAAAFLAVAIPHAYTTAHPAPATLGDLLAFTALLLFLRLRTDRLAMVPLLLVTGTLIATHHLSQYFLLIMALGTLFVRGLVGPWRWTGGSKREVTYAGILLGGTFAYWLGYATTFREFILTDIGIRPWWTLLLLFAAGLVALAALVYGRIRIPWRYRPKYPGLRHRGRGFVAAIGTILVVGLVSTLSAVPGTTFRVGPPDLLFFAPLALLLALSGPGRKFLDFAPDGIAPNAWLVVLVGSATLGWLFAPGLLIPYRHMEFLLVPFAIFAGVGYFRLLDLANLRRARRTMALLAAAFLLSAGAFTAIPPPSTLAGWREGTIPAALDAAYWARYHASGLVVSDHHGSTTVFGFGGIHATWDRTRAPFLPEFATSPYAGLFGIDSPSGLANGTYVWIDRDMQAGVRLTPWEATVPISEAVLAKFGSPPFVKVFDNGYARIYWIAWSCSPATC